MNNQNNPLPIQRGGRGRGAPRNRGGRGGGIAPLPNQIRQVEKALRTEEQKLLVKYVSIHANQIRSTYGLNGLISREIGVWDQFGPEVQLVWISLTEAEMRLARVNFVLTRDRLEARMLTRLVPNVPARLEDCSRQQRDILEMSNSRYATFLGQLAARVANVPPVVQDQELEVLAGGLQRPQSPIPLAHETEASLEEEETSSEEGLEPSASSNFLAGAGGLARRASSLLSGGNL